MKLYSGHIIAKRENDIYVMSFCTLANSREEAIGQNVKDIDRIKPATAHWTIAGIVCDPVRDELVIGAAEGLAVR